MLSNWFILKTLCRFALAWTTVLLLCLTLPARGEVYAWDNEQRIVAIGDVHGAYEAFVELLQTNDLIDDQLNWRGGNTHMVNVGDLLDRGAQSRKVMDLLIKLQPQAEKAGGRVHVLLGNHELMNLTGDLRDVSAEELAAFMSS